MKIHNRRRISRQKYSILFSSFVADIAASNAVAIARMNRKIADRYLGLYREAVLASAREERAVQHLHYGIELDESYFGARRIRGKRGRGAGGKIIVFGLLKRAGSVYTQIVPSAQRAELMPIIRRVVASGSEIYSDGWRSYGALAIYGYNHKKVKHDENEFAREDGTYINGVES